MDDYVSLVIAGQPSDSCVCESICIKEEEEEQTERERSNRGNVVGAAEMTDAAELVRRAVVSLCHLCIDMRTDMRIDMCEDMCVDMCIDMFTDI